MRYADEHDPVRTRTDTQRRLDMVPFPLLHAHDLNAMRRDAERLSGIGVWTWELADNIHWWSEEVFRIHDRDASLPPLPYPELRQYFTAESWAAIEAALARICATGQPQQIDAKLQRPQEDPRWVTIRGQAVCTPSGRVTALYGTIQDITERKKNELAIRENERRLMRVLTGSDQGFWDWDLLSGAFSVSPRFATMLGYAPHEMDLRVDNWAAYVHPDDLVRAQASIEAHLEGRTTGHEMELRCRAKSGEWRWIFTSGRIVEWTDDGRPRIMSGTHTDITPRKHAEFERAALDRRLRLALSIAPVMISQQDRALRYTAVWNPASPLRAEQIVGRSDEDVYAGADAAALGEIKRRVLTSGSGERHEIAVRLGGEYRWFDLIVEPEIADDGRCIGVLCAGVDVTERKEREERYRTVLSDQTELIARYRPDGTMTFANAMYCRFFGKSEQDIVGHTWHPAAHPDDVALIEAKLATLTPQHPGVTIENRVRTAAGLERWMQFVNRAFFEPDGTIRELQSVGRDITERKQLETELAAYRVEILRLLQENDELREQQRKEIARDIHDQIGSPLALARMQLEALLRESVEPERHERVRQIEQAVAQTIAVSRRICSELRPPALDDIGLVATCRWYLKAWSEQVAIRSALRAAAVPDRLPEQLSTDLFRAFQELLTNVAKHARATHVSASLRCTGRGLSMRIADNGCGLDASPQLGGLGLLGIRERVARHGGTLEVTDRVDGLTVRIWIPRAAYAAGHDAGSDGAPIVRAGERR